MNVVVALIAFSITMIVLSTLVVAIVEIVHEARGVRKRHMTYFLGAVFDEYIWPNFGERLPDGGTRPVRSVPSATGGTRKPPASWPRRLMRWAAGQISHLDRWDANRFELAGHRIGLPSAWWLVLAPVVLLLFLFDYVLLSVAAILLVAYVVDGSREPDRFDFPETPGEELRGRLERLDRLRELGARDGDALGETERRELAALRGDPSLEDKRLTALHRRLAKRRLFIEEISKISKSIAATENKSEKAFATNITSTEFVAQLARTEFGRTIREAARDRLETVVNEIARRYDSIGKDASQNFRTFSRRWSIAAAFVLAVVANVDAIVVFDTFYRNPEVAERVERQFAGRMEDLERALAAAATEAERTEDPAEARALEARIEQLEGRIDELAREVRTEVTGLAGLGVPIGWARFPYCAVAPTDIDTPDLASENALDGGCEIVAAKQAALLAKLKEENNEDGKKEDKYFSRFDARILAADGKDPAPAGALTFSDYLEALEVSRDEGPLTDLYQRITAHVVAARFWLETRAEAGLSDWIAGVLLGGALIGLGGPFWFDVYRRMSGIASVARSLGLRARPVAEADQAERAPADPEQAHRPRNVLDAFMTAQAAQESLERSRSDDLAYAAEHSEERTERPAARTGLNPDGTAPG